VTVQPVPSRETPQDRIPIFRWGVQEGMVRELRGERWTPSGMWIPNTVQPTWELGRRHGFPRTVFGDLDINGQNAFLPGPANNKRWFVISLRRQSTTGATRLLVRPKDATDNAHILSIASTSEQVINLPWPGIIVENDGDRFGGGDVGLQDSANGGDTGRELMLLVYETDM